MDRVFFLKKSKEALKILGINFVVLFIFLELGSLAFYYIKNKQLFYTRQKATNYQELGINLEGLRIGESVVERLHPYFGYVQKPGPDFRPGFKYNNYGFISPYDYPFIKTKQNQFIVGIFGGSVASNYSIYEVQNKILERELKKLPQFKDKEIVILSFAIGGYKQPQQLLVLNYMLSMGQKFDLVINLDGFNELALSNLNNDIQLDLTMPSTAHVQALTRIANNSLSTKALQMLIRLKEDKPKLNQSIESLKNCQLASCHVIMSIYIQNLVKNYRNTVKQFERSKDNPLEGDDSPESVIYYYMKESKLPESEVFEQISDHWVKTSGLMNQVLSANNIPYFHIIQPNQYYQTKRIFGEAEKKVAFSDDSPYKDAITKGYPVLLNHINELKANQVKVFNGVNIFDNTKEPVYIDNCCHYDKKGEEILSNFVATSIANSLKNPK